MRDLTQQSKEAIDDLFSDTSVSQEVTLDALKEIREQLDLLIECIESDLESAA